MSDAEKKHIVTSSVSVRGQDSPPEAPADFSITVQEARMNPADTAQREIDGAKLALFGLMNYWRTKGLSIDDDGTVKGASPSLPPAEETTKK